MEETSTELWHLIQQTDQYRSFRLQVRKRAKYKCECCGTKGNRKNRLHVHHTKPKSWDKYFKYVFAVRHAVLLCMKCHIEEHRRMKAADPDYNNHKKVSTRRLKNLLAKCTFNFRDNKRKRYYNKKRRRRKVR